MAWACGYSCGATRTHAERRIGSDLILVQDGNGWVVGRIASGVALDPSTVGRTVCTEP